MKEVKKLHKLYELKEVDRYGFVKKRQESSAEHTYSCLITAQYFLPKIKQKLNEKKIMKMLLYHDVVEIEAGDIYWLDKKQTTKKEHETKAFQKLKTKIPASMAKEIHSLWKEFEANKTKEAKFCQAIDKFEPVIHFLEAKQWWQKQKLSEEFLRSKKDHYFKDYPPIMKMWNRILKYVKKNNYLSN